MKPIVHKNYQIFEIENLASSGDYTAKLWRIKNIVTNNIFAYITKLSGTLKAIENIDNDKKYISAVIDKVLESLDLGIEIIDTQINITTWTREEKKNVGIFYTPRPVVEFIFDILNIYKNDEDKKTHRWDTHTPEFHCPSVIDPAAGGGDFLKVAIQKGFTMADWVFGMDIDKAAVNRWKDINLLSEFGGSSQDLHAHFFHQNGLDDIKWGQHTKSYKYKLKRSDIKNQQFDTVVGNPPYGGLGLSKEDLNSNSLIDQLSKSEILPKEIIEDLTRVNKQMDLFGTSKKDLVALKAINRLNSFPIEVLFLERFINLAKPGGFVAMIIPDGILTNSNLTYVREFIIKKCTLKTVISLPRDTFKTVKTNAKTSIIILQKNKEKQKIIKDYPIFLASVNKIEDKLLNSVVSNYNHYYNSKNKTMDNNQKVYTALDDMGKELIMIRVDKTLSDLMSEKPFSRFDANYWSSKYDTVIIELKKSKIKTNYLGLLTDSDDWLISTDHVRDSKGEKEGNNFPVEYYSPAGLLFTGYDTSKIPHCTENAFNRMKRARPLQNDVLLGGFGMGPTGKSIVIWHAPSDKSIVGNIFILRTKKFYNPFVLDTFFKTKYGKAQFDRFKTGVAFNSLSNDEIKYLLIPKFGEKLDKQIIDKYQKMIEVHDKAMEAKGKGDEGVYKENIEIAQGLLKDLIAKTEQVIRGEREDIV